VCTVFAVVEIGRASQIEEALFATLNKGKKSKQFEISFGEV
jgi:hypothetical protein